MSEELITPASRQIVRENDIAPPEPSGMIPSMIRLIVLVGLGSFLILAALPLGARLKASGTPLSLSERLRAAGWSLESFGIEAAVLIAAALIATLGLYRLLKRLE